MNMHCKPLSFFQYYVYTCSTPNIADGEILQVHDQRRSTRVGCAVIAACSKAAETTPKMACTTVQSSVARGVLHRVSRGTQTAKLTGNWEQESTTSCCRLRLACTAGGMFALCIQFDHTLMFKLNLHWFIPTNVISSTV